MTCTEIGDLYPAGDPIALSDRHAEFKQVTALFADVVREMGRGGSTPRRLQTGQQVLRERPRDMIDLRNNRRLLDLLTTVLPVPRPARPAVRWSKLSSKSQQRRLHNAGNGL
jgi:hypothetical protein